MIGEGAAALAINEDLFAEEDLEGLEEELGDLDLEEWSRCPPVSSIIDIIVFIIMNRCQRVTPLSRTYTASTIQYFSQLYIKFYASSTQISNVIYISNRAHF